MSKEYVILKGTNSNFSGYATNTQLSGSSSYKYFSGLFLKPEKQVNLEGDNDVYSTGFKMSNDKSRWGWTLRTMPITYPNNQVFIDNYFNDSLNNNIADVIKCKYIWINNDHLANGNSDGSNTRLWFVPPSEVDATTKNRQVAITGYSIIQTEGNSNFYYHLEINIEPAIR